MRDYTVLRVSVDTDAVATALDAIPGITVVEPDDRSDSGRVDVLPDRETADEDAATSETSDAAEPPFEPSEDAAPAWREYGLLGVGASLVMLGIATVGIWWYRRRNGDETDEWTPESEMPAPVDPDAVDRSTTDAETPAPTVTSPEASTMDDDDADGQTVLGDEMADADDDPPGRTEDREEVEWTTPTETVSTADPKSQPSAEPDESAPESPPETDEAETPADPRDQVDVAPLLGVAFLAVSGAVVRWVQRAGDAE